MEMHNTTRCSAAEWYELEHSTAQHSTAQHSTAQHSTAQHSTASKMQKSMHSSVSEISNLDFAKVFGRWSCMAALFQGKRSQGAKCISRTLQHGGSP